MNNPEQIINECFGESIQKVYPYFVYQNIDSKKPIFYFFEGKTKCPSHARYYGIAWCKNSAKLPFNESIVPLVGDRVPVDDGSVIEIIQIDTA